MTHDVLPTIGSAALLSEHRKRSNATLIRAKVAERLRKIAGYVAKDQIEAGSPTAAFIVLITDGEPVVTWGGEVSWDDLREARSALFDASMARYRTWDGKEQNIPDLVSEGWRNRQRHKARREIARAAEADAKPWMCEHCDKRFKTERGGNQHERGCWKNPQARQYQPGGGYQMRTRDDGSFGGFFRIDMTERDGSDTLPNDES